MVVSGVVVGRCAVECSDVGFVVRLSSVQFTVRVRDSLAMIEFEI